MNMYTTKRQRSASILKSNIVSLFTMLMGDAVDIISMRLRHVYLLPSERFEVSITKISFWVVSTFPLSFVH